MLGNYSLFSDEQAITADAASTNYVDLGTNFAGHGTPINMVIRVTEAFNNLTSLVVKVQESDSSGSGYTDVAQTPAILLADLVAGYKFDLQWLPNVEKRYCQLYFDVTGTAPTTGKITAYLVGGHDFPTTVDGKYWDPRNPSGAESTAP